MSNGHGGGQCPECEAKVILNGDIAARNLSASAAHLDAICETIERHVDANKKFSNIDDLVTKANALEDLSNAYQKKVDEFRRAVLDGMGFEGPYPHSIAV